MKPAENILSGLFGKKTPKTRKCIKKISEEIDDTISTDSIIGFDFSKNLSLSDARVQLINFSNNLSIESIKNMEDFRSLQKLVKQMSDYLLANQYEIKKISLGEIQDFKFGFRTVQQKIRRIYQDKDFIKRMVTNNGLLTYDKKYNKDFEKEVRYFYESLAIVYNAVVATFRLDSYVPIPTDMKILDKFPESFELQELAINKEKFRQVLKDVKSMSNYILDNEKEIGKFPAMQLFDFKITLEGIKGEVQFMLESDIFSQPQLYNLKKLNEPDGKLYKAYDVVDNSLKFSDELPLEKAIDLISTFGHRMNLEELSQNMDKISIFLWDMKSISKYMINLKIDINNLPGSILNELKKGLEDVEERIEKILEMESLQPKVVYNLNRILNKDLKTAKNIATN